MSSDFYTEMEQLVFEMLQEYGSTMTIHHQVDKMQDDLDGDVEYSEHKTDVIGIQQNYGEAFISSTESDIQKGDVKITMSSRKGEPQIGDNIYIGDDLGYKILNVKNLSPGDTNLLYEVRARSYRVTTVLDTIVVGLGELETGSLIADTSRVDTPVWMVIARDHHAPGTTTLVAYNAATEELGDIAYRGSGGWPLSPWSATWLRRWLLSDYSDLLSTDMLQNIYPVTTTTHGIDVIDTIFTLSKTEMGGADPPLESNGTAIEYFEHLSDRICFTTNNINVTYWTREAWGVDNDGNFTTLNPYYKHGVRPAICLRSSLDTALNYSGQYEIQWP